MPSQTQFVYFDLGNVLLDFSHQQAANQVASLCGISQQDAYRVLFEEGHQWAYESGKVTSEEIHATFCDVTQTASPLQDWLLATSDIFQPKPDVWKIAQRLAEHGFPLGILSNTCAGHWDFCQLNYPELLSRFSVHALSFRIGTMKPNPDIYIQAARLASTPPENVLFIDDRPENIESARLLGIDAIHFLGAEDLAKRLSHRGIVV